MAGIDLPQQPGSLVEYKLGRLERPAVLAPATWDPQTRAFNGAHWCWPEYDLENNGPYLDVLVPVGVSRKGVSVIHVAPSPIAGKPRRALRRPGAVATLDGEVYAYCASYRNGDDEGAWVNPVLGVGPREIEHRGIEIVPGQP